MNHNNYNIIDIGSNSVRIMTVRDKITKKFVNITKLSSGMKNGILHEIAIERTIRAILQFIDMYPSARNYLFATEAVRSAKNKTEFLNRINALTGLTVAVLTGEEEAEASFVGASLGRYATIIDIGGASTEVAYGNGHIEMARSIPLGAVRLSEKFGVDIAQMGQIIDKLNCLDFPIYNSILIGVGGTITTLASIDLKLKEYNAEAVQGHILTRERIMEISNNLALMSDLERVGVIGLPLGRADTIAISSAWLAIIMEKLNRNTVIVSDRDNAEGYAIMMGL